MTFERYWQPRRLNLEQYATTQIRMRSEVQRSKITRDKYFNLLLYLTGRSARGHMGHTSPIALCHKHAEMV